MARQPGYLRHKASGQARVVIGGKTYYLGPHGSPESRERYAAIIAAWRAGQLPPATRARQAGGPTVRELVEAYKREKRSQGLHRTTLGHIENATDALVALFGSRPAAAFTPADFKAVRQTMVDAGLARRTIAHRMAWIVQAFAFGVESMMIEADVAARIKMVKGLRRGVAPESARRRPVSFDELTRARAELSPMVAAMVDVQWLSAMRPGEVCAMLIGEVDTSRELWRYRPAQHKNTWRGQGRVVAIGPMARAALGPWLHGEPDDPVFVTRWGNPWTTDSYRQEVLKACARAGVEPWSPARLRHTRAQAVRDEHGPEAAAAVLGHAGLDTVDVYTARSEALAASIAEASG